MEIQYAGRITAAEHRKCYSLHYARSFGPMKWVAGAIIIILIVANAVLIVQRTPEAGAILRETYLYSIILLGLLTFPWWFPYTQVQAARKKGGVYQNEVSGVVDDSQVTLKGPAIQAAFQWRGFHSYKTAEGVILLYAAKNSFIIFTRSLFASQADWERFSALVHQKLSGQAPYGSGQ